MTIGKFRVRQVASGRWTVRDLQDFAESRLFISKTSAIAYAQAALRGEAKRARKQASKESER